MEITIKAEVREERSFEVEGIEFDIREDCVFITVGDKYVRVEYKDFEKILRVFQ